MNVRRPKLYLETSVWNHLFADDAPEARKDTEAFFAQIAEGRHEIYISDLVTAELAETPDAEHKARLLGAVERYQPREFVTGDEALALARRYIEVGVIPAAARDDALHVAVATVEQLDGIVSLNMRHIVRLKARHGINGVNIMEGYRQIEIATPGEVLEYDNE